jgi:hypothetical protein
MGSAPQVCQCLGVSEQSLPRWRNQSGALKADEARRIQDLEAENARLKRLVAAPALDKQLLSAVAQKRVTAEQRGQAVRFLRERFSVSQRRACRALGQHRWTQRRKPRKAKEGEGRLVRPMLELVRKHPSYGYLRIWAGTWAPGHMRSDSGPEFIARAIRAWMARARPGDAEYRARGYVGDRVRGVGQLR